MEEDGSPCMNVHTGEAMMFDRHLYTFSYGELSELGAWRKRK